MQSDDSESYTSETINARFDQMRQQDPSGYRRMLGLEDSVFRQVIKRMITEDIARDLKKKNRKGLKKRVIRKIGKTADKMRGKKSINQTTPALDEQLMSHS